MYKILYFIKSLKNIIIKGFNEFYGFLEITIFSMYNILYIQFAIYNKIIILDIKYYI